MSAYELHKLRISENFTERLKLTLPHGGLISTAIDVVRFAIHLDGLPAVHDRQCPMVTDTLTAKRNSSCKQRRALRCPSNTQGQVQANPGSSAFRACNC